MSDSIVPESRVFRIGRECYIAYLGNERDDVRPFLRIGNARDIPDEVHEVITTTVVSDDHVGNPLQEILIAPKFHGKYLGDTGVVATIRKFFKSFDLPVDEVTDFRQIRDGERRHMVWFYSSGNIHLRYDDQVIFDLDRREKEDRHFVRLYEEAKSEFLRNPLRYIRQDFSGQGVVMTEGNAYWYENGEFLSLKGHPGFVALLMSQGVDPDFISGWAYNLTADVMDTHDSAVFIGFVKRMRQRRKQLRVVTSEPDLLRKLKTLFPQRTDTPATLEILDVSGKKKATFRESILSYRDGNWNLFRAGLPALTTGPDDGKGGLSLDVDTGVLHAGEGAAAGKFSPPPGFPLEFIGHDVPDIQILDKYLGYTIAGIRDLLNEGEQQSSAALEKYLRLLRDDMLSGKTAASPLLKQSAGNLRDALRHGSPSQGGLAWFIFANGLSILERFRHSLGENHGLYKNTDQVASDLRNLIKNHPLPDPILPFWGDLYLGPQPCLLWRATKRSFVTADLIAARDVNDRIAVIGSLDEKPWQDDRDRLLKLIRSLKISGEGPLTDKELELLSRPEDEKEEQKTPPREKKAPAEPRESHRESRESRSEAPPAAGAAPRKVSRDRRKWPWLLLILLLLLLGGAVAWDLTGTAPWGRVLPGSRQAVSETAKVPGSDGTAAAGESTGVADGETPTATTDETPSESTDGTPPGTESGSVAGTTAGTTAGADAVTPTGTDSGNVTGTTPGTARETGAAVGAGAAETPVNTDVAPRTMDEVKAYLDVDGRVAITEADIHLAANEIAVINGYKDLDYKVFTGSDPDWIYPGNELKLPGSIVYPVKKGDTIWFLAAREVRLDVERDLAEYDKAAAVLENPSSDAAARKSATDSLKQISERSRAASMRKMAQSMAVRGQ